MFHKIKKSMRNFFIVISLFNIFSGSILSASDFNYDTGSALKSDLANNATITAMHLYSCLLYTSPSPRDKRQSRMPSSA